MVVECLVPGRKKAHLVKDEGSTMLLLIDEFVLVTKGGLMLVSMAKEGFKMLIVLSISEREGRWGGGNWLLLSLKRRSMVTERRKDYDDRKIWLMGW